MTYKDWKRAEILYRRYKTDSREYFELARKAGMNTAALNSEIWHRLHKGAAR